MEAFDLALNGHHEEALARLDEIPTSDPARDPDVALWSAVVLALGGQEEAAGRLLARIAGAAPQFIEIARRFGAAGLLPDAGAFLGLVDQAGGR